MIETTVIHAPPAAAPDRRPELLAYGAAVGVATLFGIALLRIPIQLSDSFTEFLMVQPHSLWDVVRSEIGGGPYFRPLRRALIKLVIDLSGGNFHPWFRGFHVLEVLLLFVLFVRMLRPKTMTSAALVPLALAMIAGSHLFLDIFREAFPINHFLTVVICAVAAVNLAESRGGRLVDAAAVLLLAFAMSTIESGLLLWVIFAVAYFTGARGVSRGALVALTAVFAAYFVLRFGVLGGTIPAIGERDTGFLLTETTAGEIRRLFGDSPLVLYTYNFLSAVSCALFAEPRSGTFMLARGVVMGELRPWQGLTVATSACTTLTIGWYVATRIRSWRPFRLDRDDRLVALFLVLLPVNAMFDIVYEKDVVLSVAGIFSVAAAMVAMKHVLAATSSSTGTRQAVAYAVILVVACGWSLRSVGTQYRLREVASLTRDDWAYYDRWERRQNTVAVSTPAAKRIWQTLYDDAIWRRAAPRAIDSRLLDAWSDPRE
jgi:hypothetical protein